MTELDGNKNDDFYGITANEARKLMPSELLNEQVMKMDEYIKKSAKNDRNSVRVPLDVLENFEFDSQQVPKLDSGFGKIFKDHYERKGFKVEDFYEEKQFVDTGVAIYW